MNNRPLVYHPVMIKQGYIYYNYHALRIMASQATRMVGYYLEHPKEVGLGSTLARRAIIRSELLRMARNKVQK